MHGLGKMCSSGPGSPLVAKDDELPENPIGEEEESTEESIDELNSTEENDSVNLKITPTFTFVNCNSECGLIRVCFFRAMKLLVL